MSLWDDSQPYLDPDTGLLMATDGGKDNLILYSAYLYRELEGNSYYTNAQRLRLSCLTFLFQGQAAPGLYRRAPGSQDDNSIDNLIGACYISPTIARYILRRWNSHFACFDVNRPAWIGLGKNWYGRFIGLKPYIKAAAGKPVSRFDKLLWSLACIWSTYRSKGASDPLLQSLQNDLMPGCRLAKMLWRRKYNVKALYSAYFGPDHPLTNYARS
jgi:hypothetical protein